MLTPVSAANCSPMVKSRLPCMKKTGTPLSVKSAQRGFHSGVIGVRIVVAKPHFKKIAEYVQGICVVSVVAQKLQKLFTDFRLLRLKVQVRDE